MPLFPIKQLAVCACAAALVLAAFESTFGQIPTPPPPARATMTPEQVQELEQLDAGLKDAQPQAGRGRGRGRGRGGFGEQFGPGFGPAREFGQAAPEGPPGMPPAAAGPKSPISLQLWVLTVALPQEKAADENIASLYDRVTHLPVAAGTHNDVVALIELLRAAGLIERMREFRHATVNGEPSQTQSGANMPMITGISTNVMRARGVVPPAIA